MLKAIGLVQVILAPVFVVPAVTGQSDTSGLDAQLEATLRSLEYVAGLRDSVRTGDRQAQRALQRATEGPRDQSTPQRSAHLEALRDDIAELRFSLDRLLGDPRELSAIMSLPQNVLKTLGLTGGPAESSIESTSAGDGAQPALEPRVHSGTSPAYGSTGATTGPSPRVSRTDIPPGLLAGTSPTTGLDQVMRETLQAEVGPLDAVRPTSRRRGDEPVSLESDGYVADPVRLGRLLVRAGRTAEAIELLEHGTRSAGERYWLARAYSAQDRLDEALELYRVLANEPAAGQFSRHAVQDLEFLEFERTLGARRSSR